MSADVALRNKSAKTFQRSSLMEAPPSPWWDAPAAVVPAARRGPLVLVGVDSGENSSSGAFGCDVRDAKGRRKVSESKPSAHQIGATASAPSTAPDTASLEAALKQCPRLVVNITATWCSPCERFKPKFQDMSSAFPDVAFVTVDIDTLSDSMLDFLAIETVPCFLVVRNGKEVARIVGVSNKRPGKPIAAAIREHLLSEKGAEIRNWGGGRAQR